MKINPICNVKSLLTDNGNLIIVGSTKQTTNIVYNANNDVNQIKQDYAKRNNVAYTDVRLMSIKNYRKRQPNWMTK